MPFQIIANSAEQQAVLCKKDEALGIVFYQPGKINAAGWEVTADRACALLLRRADGAWTISAADPAAGSEKLNLTVKREGEETRPLTITLPEGLMAGSSVSMDI